MGLFSFVGGLLGSGSQKKAARRAADAQVAALQQAIDENRRQFDVTQTNLQPWLTAGQEALGGQMDLLGLGEGGAAGQAASIEDLRGSPLYQSLYDNGEEAVLANASATGGLRGGNTQRGLANFGRDTLAQVIENMFAKLGGISGAGNETATNLGGLGAQNADAIGQAFVGQGNARASRYLAQGQINNNMWNSAGGFLDDIASSLAGGPLKSMGKFF